MSDTTWDQVSDYLNDMTELASDAATEHFDRIGNVWNKIGDDGLRAEAEKAAREAGEAVLTYTAKAWKRTSKLLDDLAK